MKKVNWFLFFKKIHLFVGLGTSILLTGVSIVGFIVRHPLLFGVDENISSLNSGVFIYGEQSLNLSSLLDLLALSLLFLTISGFAIWYYPKMIKKRKKKVHKLAS